MRVVGHTLLKRRFRRRFFRAFQAWYAGHCSQFCQPLRLYRCTDRVLEFSVGSFSPEVVKVFIVYHDTGRQDVSVAFLKDTAVVDLGYSEDVLPVRVKHGLRCAECFRQDSQAPVFRSRPALWADHLFEPLRFWLNQCLATAIRIELDVSMQGTTQIRLVQAD